MAEAPAAGPSDSGSSNTVPPWGKPWQAVCGWSRALQDKVPQATMLCCSPRQKPPVPPEAEDDLPPPPKQAVKVENPSEVVQALSLVGKSDGELRESYGEAHELEETTHTNKNVHRYAGRGIMMEVYTVNKDDPDVPHYITKVIVKTVDSEGTDVSAPLAAERQPTPANPSPPELEDGSTRSSMSRRSFVSDGEGVVELTDGVKIGSPRSEVEKAWGMPPYQNFFGVEGSLATLAYDKRDRLSRVMLESASHLRANAQLHKALRLTSYVIRSRWQHAACLVQVAGHDGTFTKVVPGVITKTTNGAELQNYKELMEKPDLKPFVPRYYHNSEIYKEDVKEEEAQGDGKKKKDEHNILIQDLTAAFKKPCVMDIKMGTRTFNESEVSNTKLRLDLLEKMIKVDPAAPTEEEKEKGITKLRYMRFREAMSSSASEGFRIEGIKLKDGHEYENIKTCKTPEQIIEAFRFYFDKRPKLVHKFIARLEELQAALAQSDWFTTRETIGSSLLFIYDGNVPDAEDKDECGIWMIDFAKTVDAGQKLTHTEEWVEGNKEDGYLIGLNGLIKIMKEINTDQLCI